MYSWVNRLKVAWLKEKYIRYKNMMDDEGKLHVMQMEIKDLDLNRAILCNIIIMLLTLSKKVNIL